MKDTPNWGITPVPDRHRVLGLVDNLLLWGSLGVSLLVLAIGSLLITVNGLSLRQAVVAMIVGAVIGNAMLGLAAWIGSQGRVPSMVLLRAPLGMAGSALATGLNVLQCLGWAIFEILVISVAAAALSDEVFGFEARWMWTLAIGATTAALALLGPVGVVRRIIRKAAPTVVVLSLGYLTWWALSKESLGGLWDRPGTVEGASVWLGVDLIIAVTVSWIPLVADYTRFSRDDRAAGVGAGVGYFVASLWMYALGVFIALVAPFALVEELPAQVVGAGFAAALALLALTIDEIDEAFANVYSAAVSTQNVVSRVSQPVLILAATAVATLGALVLEIRNYEFFLLLIGSAFVPLFGVLTAYWLTTGRRFSEDDFSAAPRLRVVPFAGWIAGFVAYHVAHGPGAFPDWWNEIIDDFHVDLGLGGSLPAFIVAFAVTFVAGRVTGRVAVAPT